MTSNSTPKIPEGGQKQQISPISSRLPGDFQTPFKRVVMRERMDDAFACIATLTGRTLDEVNRAAQALGYPQHGPAYPTVELVVKLLKTLGDLEATDYEDFESLEKLPQVAILFIDFDEEMDTGRTVIWHRVPKTASSPSFSYVIDPGSWVADERRIHMDLKSLDILWFMEITSESAGRAASTPARSS